jgi:O-antigen ligase
MDVMQYAEELSFGARVVYWWGGWNLFNRYPLLGVGLGNAGSYFPKALPAYAWRLIEVRQLLFHTDGVLNIKSLWFRLLGETGIAGFSAFFIFLVCVVFMIIGLIKKQSKPASFFAWFGLYAIAAFFIEEFSLDTFALPYFWISFALVAVAQDKVITQQPERS